MSDPAIPQHAAEWRDRTHCPLRGHDRRGGHRRGDGQPVVDRRVDLAAALHDHRVHGCRRRHRRRPGHARRRPRRPLPDLVEGVGLIVGIDRFMSEARAVTNFSGNAVATVLIGKWVGEFDPDQANRVLSGEDPFDEMTMIDDEEPPELAERPLPGHPVAAHHGEGAHHA